MVRSLGMVSSKTGATCPVSEHSSTELGPELAELASLDAAGLRQRWRSLVGGVMPSGLGRDLVLRILAYQHQTRCYGDLDKASRQVLADVVGGARKRSLDRHPARSTVDPTAPSLPAQTSDVERASTLPVVLRPGTMLAREHGGVLHRVMVMDAGFGWNGKTYDSLSKVALAITGTRWNGPRFFGLRQRNSEKTSVDRSSPSKSPPRPTNLANRQARS